MLLITFTVCLFGLVGNILRFTYKMLLFYDFYVELIHMLLTFAFMKECSSAMIRADLIFWPNVASILPLTILDFLDFRCVFVMAEITLRWKRILPGKIVCYNFNWLIGLPSYIVWCYCNRFLVYGNVFDGLTWPLIYAFVVISEDCWMICDKLVRSVVADFHQSNSMLIF